MAMAGSFLAKRSRIWVRESPDGVATKAAWIGPATGPRLEVPIARPVQVASPFRPREKSLTGRWLNTRAPRWRKRPRRCEQPRDRASAGHRKPALRGVLNPSSR
jgi:hypothetical protein